MSIEAMKLALEALKLGDTVFYPQTSIAIAAIEGVLAQQSNEQVDEQSAFEEWLYRVCPSGDVESVQRQWESSSDFQDLCNEQVELVLTEDEIKQIQEAAHDITGEQK